MQIPQNATLLRIFLGQDDRHEHQPLYEAIVMKAREHHLAGATVLRGPMGYGHSSRIHTTKVLRLSEDLPVVVEIVDSDAKIAAFLPNAIGRFKSLIDDLANVTQLQVDKARGLLQVLLGKEIVFHPTADSSARYLTAEVSGDYAELLRLAVGQNKFGGWQGS